MSHQPDQFLPAASGWYAFYRDPTMGTWHTPIIAWAAFADGRVFPVVPDVDHPGCGSIEKDAGDLVFSPFEVPQDTNPDGQQEDLP